MGKYYVTTPIYYVNDIPHIGTAYPTVAADVVARFHRMMGDDVLFSTGTDENATKVARVAIEKGADPRAYVDGMAKAFEATWHAMHISYDDFVRTVEPRHVTAVQSLVKRLYERGDVYYGEYEGWYCVPCETHLLEGQLVEGNCPECSRPVERMKEPGYFFRLSKYAQPLLDHIAANPDFLQPEYRKNEVVSFISSGLRDVNITRRSDWGIPLPEGMPKAEGLVIYVWFDAVINYITVPGFPDDATRMAKWWPADAHIVGKDIFPRFHATLWPAMLMGAGLPVPETVVAHGFWTIGGEKISKSKHSGKGFRINPLDLADEVVAASGCEKDVAVDALRYFLLREMPFGADGDFSLEALFRRYNNDLGNDLGNLLNRTIAMLGRFCAGTIPARSEAPPEVAHAARLVEVHLGGRVVDYGAALKAVWDLLSFLNRYIVENEPWKLHGAGKQAEVDRVMYTVAESIRSAAVMLHPFMPVVAERMATQLGWQKPTWTVSALAWGDLHPGAHVAPGDPLFPRTEEKKAAQLARDTAQPPAATETELISIADFARVHLKVGTVLAAERHPKADKLLLVKVDLGEAQPRQVVAGIAAVYAPETLIGRRIIVVANLQPATLRGEVSQGMLLAADLAAGGMSLLTTDCDVPNGSAVH